MTDFESFYHRYRNLMYRIAYDLLKNPQDAALVTRNICFTN